MAERIVGGIFYTTGVACKKISHLTDLKRMPSKTGKTPSKKQGKTVTKISENPEDQTQTDSSTLLPGPYGGPEADAVKIIPMKRVQAAPAKKSKPKTQKKKSGTKKSPSAKKPKKTKKSSSTKKTKKSTKSSKARKASSTKKIMRADFKKEKGKIDLKNFG